MKKALLMACALIVLVACQKSKPFTYQITGEGWEVFDGNDIQFLLNDTTEERIRMVAKATITDGQFSVEGKIEAPQSMYLGIYDSEGIFKGWKQEMILEPQKITLAFDGTTKKAKVTGGHYNKILYADVEKMPEVKGAKNKLDDYAEAFTALSKDKQDEAAQKKYSELFQAYKSAKDNVYKQMFETSKDPMVRLMAMSKGYQYKNWKEDLKALEAEMGAVNELKIMRHNLFASEEAKKNRIVINVGDQVKDFTATNLNDNEFHLKEILVQNKYVLVEFWASWCAPCRAEIPHMKKAHKHYHDKGFEIVSFTLDNNLKAWQKASDEEKLPWVNVGDLKAYKSPVVKMYGVQGVPANYLVDSEGQIIAKHLRGDALDKKLEELLN
ncbi:MAG: redoxin domain-containing protein [Bacteroidales bacterium]|nr:redoxin domain-containing protein [Bacteroidales bacterium]